MINVLLNDIMVYLLFILRGYPTISISGNLPDIFKL